MGWIQAIAGAIQGVSAWDKSEKRKDVELELEKLGSPTYRKNQSIIDFYDEALRKYKVSPTETAEYKLQKQNINQGVIQGLNAFQNRRSAMGGVSSLISGQNNALLKAASKAEQDKQRQGAIVSNAAQSASAENLRDYQLNQRAPFEQKYNLLAAKAAGLSKVQNAQTQNAYSNLSAFATSLPEKKTNDDEEEDNTEPSVSLSANKEARQNRMAERAYQKWANNGSKWWKK